MDFETYGKRKHRRVKLVYPAEFKVLSNNPGKESHKGLLLSLSLGGALLQFDDKYGLIKENMINNTRLKLNIKPPHGEKIFLFAVIRYIIKSESREDLSISLGIEFEELEEWQLDVLESIISLRKRDQKMMWNLWDSYAGEPVKQ